MSTGYRPDAVDFFSLLKAYSEIGSGLPGGLGDSKALLTDMKFAIANALIADLRDVEDRLWTRHEELEAVLTPGNIVITLNWDLAVERYAYCHDIPIRLDGNPDPNAVLLLKLHGSIDWTLRSDTSKPRSTSNYAVIRERLGGPSTYTINIKPSDRILRTRAVENWGDAWRKIKSRTSEPFMVTMSQGKASDLQQIETVWQSAYNALSAARKIHIIGYSMPHDDVEVRALLRAGIQRGSRQAEVSLQNPSPDVHDRVRNYLDRAVRSSYLPFPGFSGT